MYFILKILLTLMSRLKYASCEWNNFTAFKTASHFTEELVDN